LPDITPAGFFLYKRAKLELAGISLSQDSFKTSSEGVVHPSPKTSSLTPFGGGWTAVKSAFKSVVNWHKKVPK
jgi:hypothetical protein